MGSISTGRGTNQREFRQVQADGIGAGAFAHDDIDGEILHGGVEDLFDYPVQAVDLVDEEDIAGVQVGQQGGQIAGLFDGGAGCDPYIHAHLIGDNPGEGRFAQTGRAVKEGVVQRLVTLPGGFDIYGQGPLGLFLAGIIGQQLGAQADLPRVLGREGGGNNGTIQFLRKFYTH